MLTFAVLLGYAVAVTDKMDTVGTDPATPPARVEVYRMRVNFMEHALIDDYTPTFSWSLRAIHGPRGVVAVSHRIVVSAAAAAPAPAAIWSETNVVADTGFVVGSATNAPLHLSSVLKCNTLYAWGVQVKVMVPSGAAAATTVVGAQSTFRTGLFAPGCWKNASWIGGRTGNLLRQTFAVPPTAAAASGEPTRTPGSDGSMLYVACPGYCKVTLNGVPVTNAVLGHQTLYERTVLYDAYSVGHLLHPGAQNAIGVEIGNGWYGSFEASCKAAAPTPLDCAAAKQGHGNPHVCLPYCWQAGQSQGQLGERSVMVALISGSAAGALAVSDLTWQQHTGPVVADDIYFGETQDARLALPGWDTVDFDASSWIRANRAADPGGALVAASSPPIRFRNTTSTPVPTTIPLSPRAIRRLSTGTYVLDFGYNSAAMIRVELGAAAAAAGAASVLNITITTHEQVHPGTGAGNGPYPSTQRFIVNRGHAAAVFETKFTYFGFQYLQVECAAWPQALPADLKVMMLPVATDVHTTGFIEFKGPSAPLFGKIQAATVNSGLSNLNSVPTDCPTRERRGYLGDGQVASDAMASNFDMAATYRHFLHVIQSDQNSVGSVPAKVPAYPPAVYYNNDAGWTVAYPLIVRLMLRRYNDEACVQAHYGNLLGLWRNVSGFVPKAGVYKDLWLDADQDGRWVNGDLGDWNALLDEWPFDPTKEQAGHTPSGLISTFWLIQFAEAMAEFATVLGKPATDFKAQAAASSVALHARFWGGSKYRTSKSIEPPRSILRSGIKLPPSMTLQALPLWGNITPPTLSGAAVSALVSDLEKTERHLLSGIVGTKYILPVLATHGHLDVALDVLASTTQPSFGYTVGPQNLTTLMEGWSSSADVAYGSKNHIMFGSVSAFFFEHVAAIRRLHRGCIATSAAGPAGGPKKPARQQHDLHNNGCILIHPQPMLARRHLTRVAASQQYEEGLVSVAWAIADDADDDAADSGSNRVLRKWLLNVTVPPLPHTMPAVVRLDGLTAVSTVTEGEGSRSIWGDGALQLSTKGKDAASSGIVVAGVRRAAATSVDLVLGSGVYTFALHHTA